MNVEEEKGIGQGCENEESLHLHKAENYVNVF